MSLLADWQIEALCRSEKRPMLTPFIKSLIEKVPVSYGPSSYGYDIRLGDKFGLYKPSDIPLDPKRVSDEDVTWVEADLTGEFILPARGFCLAKAVEYFRMPGNVTGLVKDKSTYARCGVHVQNTVIEAGWEGILTLEINNHLDRPVILRVNQGIAQVLFEQSDKTCDTSYAARGGKYQHQTDVTLPRSKFDSETPSTMK